MSLLELLQGSFDFWFLVNILTILFSVFVAIKAFLAMRYDERMGTLKRLRTNARRKREYSQPVQHQQDSLSIVLPESTREPPREQYMNGNDLRVVSRSLLKKTTAQKISENIGET
jgi:hypothetical protein